MLGLFGYIRNWKPRLGRRGEPPTPMELERLEPRIMLSGDGLLGVAPLDPLLDNAQQVIRHAELLETNEHVEE